MKYTNSLVYPGAPTAVCGNCKGIIKALDDVCPYCRHRFINIIVSITPKVDYKEVRDE